MTDNNQPARQPQCPCGRPIIVPGVTVCDQCGEYRVRRDYEGRLFIGSVSTAATSGVLYASEHRLF